MKYSINYSKQSLQFLKKLSSKNIKLRLIEKIKILSENPFISDTKRLQNSKYYRVRVGSYRIIYDVDNEISVVGIVKIGKRNNIYND